MNGESVSLNPSFQTPYTVYVHHTYCKTLQEDPVLPTRVIEVRPVEQQELVRPLVGGGMLLCGRYVVLCFCLGLRVTLQNTAIPSKVKLSSGLYALVKI